MVNDGYSLGLLVSGKVTICLPISNRDLCLFLAEPAVLLEECANGQVLVSTKPAPKTIYCNLIWNTFGLKIFVNIEP